MIYDSPGRCPLQERTISDMDASGPGSELARMAYAYEGARARYVLKAYLRTRLLKIEKYMTHVLDVAEVQERLSPEEMSFASVSAAGSARALAPNAG